MMRFRYSHLLQILSGCSNGLLACRIWISLFRNRDMNKLCWLIVRSMCLPCVVCGLSANSTVLAKEGLRVATFDVDASPPVGSPLAYDPTKEITEPLSCRGIVLAPGDEKPIVLCTVDWLGIANAAHQEFRERMAVATGTTADRVSVHTLHQHDAPRCDFSAEAILVEFGHGGKNYDERFCRDVFVRAADAAKTALSNAKTVSHFGVGSAEVVEVASNRRLLGEDGRVQHTRYTACRDPDIRALPVGTIDPLLRMVTFRAGDEVVATLTFYATHPQSYYRTGQANPDFPGMARNALQKQLGSPVIHFNGAGGNIGAGKWNDGSQGNRQVLADKVLKGMTEAEAALKFESVNNSPFLWKTAAIALPIGDHLVEDALVPVLKDEATTGPNQLTAAKHLAWLRRAKAGITTDIGCLSLGPVRILFMPGELFVEYQLAAQKMAPEQFVAMAAYGEYGPGYVCTKIAYSQGGYEPSDRASRVSPAVEEVLMTAMKKLLADEL